MPDDSCVLIVPGPSCRKVLAEDFPGKIVIAVTAAAVLRNYRCDWWICDSPLTPAAIAQFPPRLKVVTRQVELDRHGCGGVDRVAMREAAGAPKAGYAVSAIDGLILAHYLGYRTVEVYGLDWSNFASLRPGALDPGEKNRVERMRMERERWLTEATRSGIRLLRVAPDDGAIAETPPVASRWAIHWAGPPLPFAGKVSNPIGYKSNDSRREEIARLTAEIVVMEQLEGWLRQVAALGVAVPQIGAMASGAIELDTEAWARVGPGVRAEIEAGRLLARVEEKRLFAPAGVA